MRLGIIGGSGLYQMAAVEDAELVDIDTPWGRPSDSLLLGRIGDTPVAFLPRHGRGHRLAPSELNYRANIAALKMAGCTDVLSLRSDARRGGTGCVSTCRFRGSPFYKKNTSKT